jgi:hypothetical protein
MQLKQHENIIYEIITVIDTPSHLEKEAIADFIFKNQHDLKDTKESVFMCIEFAFGHFKHSGGFVVIGRDSQKMNTPIIGCAVINQTSMIGYVSENLLVYLTINKDYKNQDVSKILLEQALQFAKGNIDAHVYLSDENKSLLEAFGFNYTYKLYRLKRK